MKKNIQILEVEPKLTKNEKKYWRFKTNEGWMSCFNDVAVQGLKDKLNAWVSVEVIQKSIGGKDFFNIVKHYGPAEEQTEEKIEVVKMSEKSRTNGSMYAAYAKDLFVSMVDKGAAANEETMIECVKLINLAKEAFN